MLVGIIVVLGLLICAFQAIRSSHLLISAVWLAGSSALTALLIYLFSTPELAVIELSVGAGLVTVLFVFAINITGEDPSVSLPAIPHTIAWVLVIMAIAALGWMVLPNLGIPSGGLDKSFSDYMWTSRKLDVYLQTGIIFAGVLGVLSLLSEDKSQHEEAHS